jgi:hypothetical protein
MKPYLLSFPALFFCSIVMAQAPLVKQWDKRFGGIGMELLYSIQQTADGGYALAGASRSNNTGDRTQPNWDPTLISDDYWIIKIDSVGNKQWDKRFGGTEYDDLYAMQQTADGGYLLGGISVSDSSGDKTQHKWGTSPYMGDYWIVKIDSVGNKQWDKRYGGNEVDAIWSLQQTFDGGYILGGMSRSDTSGDKSQPSRGLGDYWIVKIDAAGNKLWDKRFGGTDEDRLTSLQQTSDKGYILGGTSYSGIGGDKTQACWDTGSLYRGDYWVVKTDSLGNKQWDKRFGGTSQDELNSLRQTADGGYILAGESYSGNSGDKTQANRGGVGDSDYWIVKIDSLGNKQWDKRFGGTGYEDEFGNIFELPGGGYIITGASYSPMGGDKSENNLGAEQTWVIKIDASGTKLWDKTIFTAGHDETGYTIRTRDGCLAIANQSYGGVGGYKTEPKWDIDPFSGDYWIVKFCDTSLHCNLSSPAITASQTIFCADDSALVCAASGYASYVWNTGATTACINANLAGSYYVAVTDNNGCSVESNHLAITVHPLPPVAISVNGDTLSVYHAVTQQWYLNGNAINNATSNIYIPTQGGSYTVSVTDSNGCVATSNPVVISGIVKPGDEDMVTVYPNPLFDGNWQLKVGNDLIGSAVEIVDVNGRVVFYSTINSQQSIINAAIAAGIYHLRIGSVTNTVIKKLVRL